MGKVHLDTGIDGEALVFAHLLALVVREGLLELGRHRAERSRVRFPNRCRVFLSAEWYEERVPGRPLDQGTKCRPLVPPDDEITLPVAGDGAVCDLRWPLLNGEHVRYLSALLFGALPALPAVRMLLAERLDERALEFASGKHIDEAVHGFVADAHIHLMRILLLKASLYLARRPLVAEPLEHVPAQVRFLHKAALAVPPCARAPHRALPCGECPVSVSAAVVANLSRYGARASPEAAGDISLPLSTRYSSANFLTFSAREPLIFFVHTNGIIYPFVALDC